MLDRLPLSAVGFADNDALLPAAASEHAAYRLLSDTSPSRKNSILSISTWPRCAAMRRLAAG